MVILFEKTELLHCFQDIAGDAEKWKLLDLPPSRLQGAQAGQKAWL